MSTIKIRCKAHQSISIEKIFPFQDDLKELSEVNYKKLKQEIINEGFSFPLFVWPKDGIYNLVDGHQRFATLNKLKSEGYTIPDLPCAVIEASDINEAKRKILAATSSYGKIDDQGLYEFMEKNSIDMSEVSDRWDFGDRWNEDDFRNNFYSEPEVEVLDAIEDEVPELKESSVTVKGDVWLLGDHRVMCGDSTLIDDVEKLMNGQKADMVFTDPPYGMFLDASYDKMFSNDKSHRKTGNRFDNVKGDHEDFNPDFINNIFGLFGYCKEIFLWGADYYSEHLVDKNSGSWTVWDKRCNDQMDKVVGNTFELCWSKAKHKRMVARIMWSGHHGMAKDDTKKRVHPTQKPVELINWFFDCYPLKEKNKVVDLFLGSGSTLIACEKTNRKCYGMELDEGYCDVIVKRWQEYTGQTAILESTGLTFDAMSKNRGVTDE